MKKITLTTIIITLLITQLINAQQTITTYSTGYNSIEGITINSNNEVFVSEHDTGKVYIVDDATGNRTEYASTGGFYANNIIMNSNDELFITEPYMDKIFIKNSSADASVYVDINIEPNSFAIDSNGGLYLSSNSKVVKINSDLTLTDYATGFLYAEGMAFDSNDNLYVADRSDRKLYKVLPDGTKNVVASNIENIRGVAIDPNDKIYFTKKQTYPEEKKILKYDPTTNMVTDFVTTDLDTPRHIAIDNLGNMYVTDRGTETIVKINDPSLLGTTPQIVNIPDVNFKAYLVGNPNINTNGDGEIQVTEAENTTVLIMRSMNIADLTGIETFVNLIKLDCSFNQLTTLDLSQNIALQELYCGYNQLTNLGISNNTALIKLKCMNNQLTNLNVNNNTSLKELFCNSNPIGSLDISNNVSLTKLRCSGNQLTNLNVNNNTSLIELNCSYNQLTNLDVSNNTSLIDLICNSNLLTSLDVNNNTSLEKLNCSDNQISNLNVSINLTELNCSNNQLTSLDINTNSNLTELNCSNNQLINIDVSNNVNLIEFNCYNNQLTSLDVNTNIDLTNFDCASNEINALNLNSNIDIIELSCCNNHINTLDLSNNINLSYLCCGSNQMSNLNVSNCLNLTHLACSFNELSTLDVSHNVNLTYLHCNFLYQVSTLDLSNNANLTQLYCNNSSYTYINLKNGNNENLIISGNNAANFQGLSALQDVCVDELNTSLTDYITDQTGHSVNFSTDCSTLSVSDNNILEFSVYPIPTENILNIKTTSEISKIEIYSKLGQLIKETTESQINIFNLAQGLYFVKVKDVNGNFGIKKIVKK